MVILHGRETYFYIVAITVQLISLILAETSDTGVYTVLL